MKFIHIADMHFDCPFNNLSDIDNLGEIRRLQQREVFKKIIEYIKEKNIEFLFIAGDLYEQQYIRKSTIEYINSKFKEIPNTKIFIAPGNHDPFLKNSYYNKYEWNDNVKIFGPDMEKVSIDSIDLYGFGFNDFYCSGSQTTQFEIEDKEKTNILIMHADLDASINSEKVYNPISKTLLKNKGFDYIALGHIHKTDYKSEENQRIVYPGSTISNGFDELGNHGMIVGEIENKKINLEFIVLDEMEFKEVSMDCTDIFGKEELIEKINDYKNKNQELYKIILTGDRNFEINPSEILKLNNNKQVLKIKDETKLTYDLNKMQNDTTLKGIFIKEMISRLDKAKEEEKEIIQKAIEIGLQALE